MRDNLEAGGGADRYSAAFGVALAVLLGAIARLLPMAGTDFPLNDGGLFVQMTADLVANGFWLPAFTTYNGPDIPFAYPPLGLYLAGFLVEVLPLSTTDVFRAVPLLLSVATIPALYWLASAILRSRSAGVFAAICFALIPRSYALMITGGGITRALGFLLAIVAIRVAWGLLQRPDSSWRSTVLLGLLGGLTALAHPQAAVFLAATIVVFLLFATQRRTATIHFFVSGLIGLVVASPWLIALVSAHGVDPLLSGASSGGNPVEGFLLLLTFRFTDFALLDLIAAVALAGVVVTVSRREWLLPVWLIIVFAVDSRAGQTYATVPLAMLASYTLLTTSRVWLPVSEDGPVRWVRRHAWRAAAYVGLLYYLIVAGYLSGLRPNSPLFALSQENRQAMEVVRTMTRGDAKILVLSGASSWETDATAEWFPTLTHRHSISTVQGYEWLGADAWDRQIHAYLDLRSCADDVLPCVVDWADRWDREVEFVYLPKGRLQGPQGDPDCCASVRHSVDLVRGARVVYDGPGATVIELP